MPRTQPFPDTQVFDFQVCGLPCQMTDLAREYTVTSNYYRHCHSAFEMHYVFQGSCTILAGSQQYNVPYGSLILIAPGIYHSIKAVTPDISKICMSLKLFPPSGECRNPDIRSLCAAFHGFDAVTADISEHENLFLSIRKMPKEELSQSTGHEKMKAYLVLLFLSIYDKLTERNSAAILQSDATTRRSSIIDNFFNANFQLPNGSELLAEQLRVSVRQMERILKKQYGMGYRQKQQEIRLEIAMDLLLTTDKSISQIAEQIGYESVSNFCTFIKRMTGMSPTEVRRSQKNQRSVRIHSF